MALPLFVVILYTWHFAFAFEAALRHGWVHALQHESFLLGALLVWWPAIEPMKRPMPGELWKAGYIFAARMLSMFLGMAFIVSRHAAYAWYADKGRTHGLTTLTDQQLAGGLMLSVDIIVMVAALAYFFWQASLTEDRREASERPASVPG